MDDKLIADFFGGDVQQERTSEQIRARLLAHIDEQIDAAKTLDQVAQNIAHGIFGTLGMGAQVRSGVWDKDGAEVFRWLRETVEAMDAEELEIVAFE